MIADCPLVTERTRVIRLGKDAAINNETTMSYNKLNNSYL